MNIWPFCESFYGRKPVATLCLQLQEEHQLNIGLIIWLCWHTAHDRFVDRAAFSKACRLSESVYDPLILPLRSVRKKVLESSLHDEKSIYQHVLSAEILMEKSVLLLLDRQLASEVAGSSASEVYGLLDYLSDGGACDCEQSVRFLYANALSCVGE